MDGRVRPATSPRRSPIEYRSEGAAVFTVVGTPDDLQALVTSLPDEIDVDVNHVGEYDDRHVAGTGPELTDRQRQVVRAALDIGYYDSPRTGSLDEVAVRLNCATGNVSELLRRAERTALGAAIPGRSEPTH